MPKSRKNQPNNKKRQRSTKKQHGGKKTIKDNLNLSKEYGSQLLENMKTLNKSKTSQDLANTNHKKLVLDLLKAKKEDFQKDPNKTVEINNINAIIAILDQTAPLKDIQLFDDLLKMHNQTSSKNERTKIYKEIADFYIKNICEGVNPDCEIPEGNKPLNDVADKAEIQKNNEKNKKNSERKTRLRNKIKHIIKGLRNPAFVTRVQAYSETKKDETQFTLEDTRRILVEILDKYNSNNYLNLDDVIETFFPETYDGKLSFEYK